VCSSVMRYREGLGVACGLLSLVEMVHGELGSCLSSGGCRGFCLARRGGGEGERGPGECLHREVSEREGLLQGFLKYCTRLAWIFSSPLPDTKGQEGGVLLQYQVDQRKG
jgi:hypothetical protein